MKRNVLIGVMFLLLTGSAVEAQPAEEGVVCHEEPKGCPEQLQAQLHFRWDSSELDPAYLDNEQTLRTLSHRIDSVGVAHIDSVVIISQSSPEGPERYNHRLSARRAETMRRWVEEHHAALAERLSVYPDGESWEQLRALIAADNRLKDATIARLLTILDDTTTSIDTKKWRITHDPVYRYLYRTYYPRIRNSMVCVVYYRPELSAVAPTVVALPVTPLRATTFTKIPPPIEYSTYVRDTLTVALKSNLLYDAVTALNVEVELPISSHWSVAVSDIFPWWEHNNKYCLQLWELGIEGRYWFRENRYHTQKLQGHFLGLHARSAKYDVQWKHDACYQGEYWTVGLTYGYAMPLSHRFNLEFSLSVGYLSTDYRHYYPAEDYSELIHNPDKDGRSSYFGPTLLKVALVWPLHIPCKKGGRR